MSTMRYDPTLGLFSGKELISIYHIISLVPSSTADEYTLLYTDVTDLPSPLRKTLLVAPPAALVARYNLPTLPPHLDPAVVDISIVVSAGSGTGKALPYWTDLVQPLLAEYGLREGSYTVHITTSAAAIHEIAAGVSAPGKRRQSLILLSGDTLLFELLNSLAPPSPEQKRPIISLLPLGTGNALSVSLSKSSPPLSSFLLGTPHPLPGFKATFPPGAYLSIPNSGGTRPLPPTNALHGSVVFSWGFHASLVADSDTPEFREKGNTRFQLAARANLLPEPHGYEGIVSILPMHENTWVELPAHPSQFYTLVSMVANLEQAFCISPASEPLMGALHVVHFPLVTPPVVTRLMGLVYEGGRHVTDPVVRYERVRGLRVQVAEEDERWRRVCVDGAIAVVPVGGRVEVEIVPGVVDVVYRGD